MKQSRELAKVETTFSALNVWPNLTSSTSVYGDFCSNNKSDEDKIEERVALVVKREKDGKKVFKCWTCNEYGHYASKCPKREKKYKGKFRSRRSRDCLYVNEDEELD